MVRFARALVIWSVVFSMAVDPVFACRWLRARRSGPAACFNSGFSGSCNSNSCYSNLSCGSSYYSNSSVYSSGYSSSCQGAYCSSTVYDSGPVYSYPLDHGYSAPMVQPTVPSYPVPSELPPPSIAPGPAAPAAPAVPDPFAPRSTPDRTPTPPARDPAFSPPAPDTLTPPPGTAPTTPARPSAPADEFEDLFRGTPPRSDQPAAPPTPPAADDLFREPAPAPTSPAPPSTDVDDLFRDTRAGTDKTSQLTATQSQPTTSELDDLFGEPLRGATLELAAPTQQANSPAVEELPDPADAMRDWVDNTGNYRVRARLVVIGENHVRLLKDTGKYTTVPLERLSVADLAFVRLQSAASLAGN